MHVKTQDTHQPTQQGLTTQDQTAIKSTGKNSFSQLIAKHNPGKNELKEEAVKAIGDNKNLLSKLAYRDSQKTNLLKPFIKIVHNNKSTPEEKQDAIVKAVDQLISDGLTDDQADKFKKCINESKRTALMRNNINPVTKRETSAENVNLVSRIPRNEIPSRYLLSLHNVCDHAKHHQEDGYFDSHKIKLIRPVWLSSDQEESTGGIFPMSCKELEELKKNQPISNQQAEKYKLKDDDVILVTYHRRTEPNTISLFRICNIFRFEFSKENSFPDGVHYLSITLRVENDFKPSRTFQLHRKSDDSKQSDIRMTVTDKPCPLTNSETENQHNLDIIFSDVEVLWSFSQCFADDYKEDDSYCNLKKDNKIKFVTNKSSCTTAVQDAINDIVENVLITHQYQMASNLIDGRIMKLCPNQQPQILPETSEAFRQLTAYYNSEYNTLDCKSRDDASYRTGYPIESQRLVMKNNHFEEGDTVKLDFIG